MNWIRRVFHVGSRDGESSIIVKTAIRYVSALLVVLIAIGLRLALDPVLGRTGFAIFLTAMLVAAWVGGVGPCLIAQTAILFAEALLFVPARPKPPVWTIQGMVSVFAFYSVGLIVGSLSEAWRTSRERVRTETAEALSQRERLRTTLACMGDGVLVTDAKGRITLMNRVAESMTGWSLAEAEGHSVHDVFAMLDNHSQELTANPIVHVLNRQEMLRDGVQFMLTTRTNRKIPVSYSAAPISDGRGEMSGVVYVFRDETERRRTERALQQADKRKDEFLATLAHELRNPLAPIAMGLELMKFSSDPASLDEIRTMMERQSQHMVRLIDDLLDVSRITRGKLELRREQVALRQIVQNALDVVRPMIDESSHHLISRLPGKEITLFVDPNRITQVLTNLLANAAKYTPSGGRIELAAEAANGEVVLTVSDNGRGIAAEQLGIIFDMFMQLRDAKERGHQGLGIGLTLVKRLVEMHGGSVEAASAGLGEGSEFRVRLPAVVIAPQNGAAESANGAPAARPAARRVLVVDDNEDVLKSTSKLIRTLGSEVREAGDGLEAIETAAEFRPDVILMDLGMPRLNGFEAASRIREEPWGEDVILVATSGWGHDEDRRRTRERGFDHHLVKPVLLADLQAVLMAPLPKRATSDRIGIGNNGCTSDTRETDGNAVGDATAREGRTSEDGSKLDVERNGDAEPDDTTL